MQLFSDTTFLVALFNVKDAHHRRAVEEMRRLAKQPSRLPVLITTDYIFDELITALFIRTKRHDIAVAAGRTLLEPGPAKVMRLESSTFDRAWRIFVGRKDKQWSFTDCTSFSFMEELGLREALSFDSNFEEAGFVMRPGAGPT